MLRRVGLFLGLFFLPSVALAAGPYYFSDCATGGSGTLADPYCLRPGTSATNVSVDYLFDGAGNNCPSTRTEACAGDSIYLCAGSCDGSGSATYDVAATSSYWLKPTVNMFNPRVTIRAYAGETVEVSGETNNVPYMFGLTDNQGGFNFADFTIKRAASDLINIDCNNTSCGNLSFAHMTLKEANDCAWGDTDGVGNNVGCLPDSQGGFIFYMLGLGFDVSVTDSTISEAGGMAIRHILSDSSFGTTHNYTVQWINNTFRNTAQIANIWQTWDWEDNRGATIIFRGNTFEGWWGSLGLEQRNKGAIFENNTFICSDTYNMDFPYGMSECQSAISVSEGDYGAARRGGNAGHIFRRNIITGAHLGANRAGEKGDPGWLQTGIKWEDSCMDNSLCTGLGTPWCCCMAGTGVGRCNLPTAGGNCASQWFNYGCISGVNYGNLIENNVISATYDCGSSSSCSGPANNSTSTGIYINTNSPISVVHNTIYSNDYGIVADNSYGSAEIHLLQGNIVSGSTVRVMTDLSSTSSTELRGNNLYNSGNPYSLNGSLTACADVDEIGDDSNICTAPQFSSTAGTVPSAWDLHIKASGPDYNVLVAGPLLDIDNETRPFDPTGLSATPFDRGADESRPEELYIEWTTPVSDSGDLHCGPFGAPTDDEVYSLIYGNRSSVVATNVVVILTWTSDADFVSTTCPSCVNAGDLLTCTIGTMGGLTAGACTVNIVCPSVNPRHGLTMVGDIKSDQRAICATDETLLGCGNFPAPTVTQGLP